MNSLFIPYDIALSLKEIGFDEPCLTFYLEHNKHLVMVQQENVQAKESYWQSNSKCNFGSTDMHLPWIAAPLYDQVIDWFFKKHKLAIWTQIGGYWKFTLHFRLEDKNGKHWPHDERKDGKYVYFESRQNALQAGIKKAIELIKQKK